MAISAEVHTDAQQLVLLSPLTITTAISATATTPVVALGGIKYLTAIAVFTYGSAGTTAKAYVQTSLDGGLSWVDVICFSFTTATATKISSTTVSLAPASQAFAPTDGTLTNDTILQGVLGDRIRLKYVTTGTYADATTLAIYALVKG